MSEDVPLFNSPVERYFYVHEQKYILKKDWETVALQMGKSVNTARVRHTQLKKEFLKLPANPKEFAKIKREYSAMYQASYNINPDGTVSSSRVIKIHKDDLKSPSSLLEAHGFDPKQWEITSATNNYWQGLKSWRHGGGSITLYQSKIKAKKIAVGGLSIEAIDLFFNSFDGGAKSTKKKPLRYKANGLMLEVAMPDIHTGLLPHRGKNEIEERVDYVLCDIEDRTKSHKYEKVIFVLPGDVMHFDTPTKTTTKGTPQDSDLSQKQMFDLTCTIIIDALERLAIIAPVELIITPGNHAQVSEYALAKAMEYYFKDNDNITVDTQHDSRIWRKWGLCLIGWCHKMAKNKIGKWLHVEAREEYGKTKYAEIHVAHLHHQVTLEDNGVIVRHLPSLSQESLWEYDAGFVGALEAACCFVWDKEAGLREQWYTNV